MTQRQLKTAVSLQYFKLYDVRYRSNITLMAVCSVCDKMCNVHPGNCIHIYIYMLRR